MDKWVKDALKKAEAGIIAETSPRSSDRKYARWILSVVRQSLLEEYAVQMQAEVAEETERWPAQR